MKSKKRNVYSVPISWNHKLDGFSSILELYPDTDPLREAAAMEHAATLAWCRALTQSAYESEITTQMQREIHSQWERACDYLSTDLDDMSWDRRELSKDWDAVTHDFVAASEKVRRIPISHTSDGDFVDG